MDVRHKLLGAFLAAAALVAATGGIVLHADSTAAQQAAVTTAEQMAYGAAKDVALGLPPAHARDTGTPLFYNPEALAAYIQRGDESQTRDIVVVDRFKRILADVDPRDTGTLSTEDAGG